MKRWKQSITIGTLALVCLTLAWPAPALAQVRMHPALFALPSTVFPEESQLVRNGVETNGQLGRDDAGHFGLPASAIGRITGYYMDAHQVSGAENPPGYTSYLVSIFSTVRGAKAAYSYRWDTWFDANYHTTPSPVGIPVGDANASASFTAAAPQLNHLTELMFRRGAVLVEVFQAMNPGDDTATWKQALYAITTQLDTIAAGHRRGW